jgi:hypothetical protein
MDLKSLTDRPSVSPLPQRVRIDPKSKRMRLLGHEIHMGRGLNERQRKPAEGVGFSFVMFQDFQRRVASVNSGDQSESDWNERSEHYD